MSTTNSSRRPPGSDYWRAFLVEFGAFPHPCYFCGEPVAGYTKPRDGYATDIHHVDGDPWNNNASENLRAAHQRCHSSHHNRGRIISREQREQVRVGVMLAIAEGRLAPPPSRAGTVAPNRGKKASAETRAKLSAAHQGVPLSKAHREALSKAGKGRRQSPEWVAKRMAAVAATKAKQKEN